MIECVTLESEQGRETDSGVWLKVGSRWKTGLSLAGREREMKKDLQGENKNEEEMMLMRKRLIAEAEDAS